VPSMRTLSTGYQRPHPRIITRSSPFLPAFGHGQTPGIPDSRRAEEGLVLQGRASSGGYSLIASVTPFKLRCAQRARWC